MAAPAPISADSFRFELIWNDLFWDSFWDLLIDLIDLIDLI